MSVNFENSSSMGREPYVSVQPDSESVEEVNLPAEDGGRQVFRFAAVTPPQQPPPPQYFAAAMCNGEDLFGASSSGIDCISHNGRKYGNTGFVNNNNNDDNFMMDAFLIRRQQMANCPMPYHQAIPPISANLNVLPPPINPYEATNNRGHQLLQRLPNQQGEQQQQQQLPPQQPAKKPKRPRTAYSSNQLMTLEQAFLKEKYLNRRGRITLSRDLSLSEKQVKVWFQNRRMKFKKEQAAANRSGTADEGSDSTRSTPTPPRALRNRQSPQQLQVTVPSTTAPTIAGMPSPVEVAVYDRQHQPHPPPYMPTEQSWQYNQYNQQYQFPQYQCQYPNDVQFWPESNMCAGLEMPVQMPMADPLPAGGMLNGAQQQDVGFHQMNMLNGTSVEQMIINSMSNSSSGSSSQELDSGLLTQL